MPGPYSPMGAMMLCTFGVAPCSLAGMNERLTGRSRATGALGGRVVGRPASGSPWRGDPLRGRRLKAAETRQQ